MSKNYLGIIKKCIFEIRKNKIVRAERNEPNL
jgi:hypothetical protein